MKESSDCSMQHRLKAVFTALLLGFGNAKAPAVDRDEAIARAIAHWRPCAAGAAQAR